MYFIRALPGLAASMLLLPSAFATVAYDEAVSGDLSGARDNPTLLSFADGSNRVSGSTGSISGVLNSIDRDYLTFTLSAGSRLDSLTVLSGTNTAGSVSFIGVEAGSKMTLDPDAKPFPDPAVLLGWRHYSKFDIGTDILPAMGVAANTGSQGFTVPLGAGSYTFWIQETGAGPVTYNLDFSVSSIPEPASALFLLAGLSAFGVVLRRRATA